MKHMKWFALLLAVFLLPLGACADFALSGISPHDSYTMATDAFKAGHYLEAIQLFSDAANFQDAKKWLFYCQAIHDVITYNSTPDVIANAGKRFQLLSAQSFEQADQWATYCTARSYDLDGYTYDAAAKYAEVVVYNSIERYLACMGSEYSNLLESQETVQKRHHDAGTVRAELYKEAKAAYDIGRYAYAADYFCLAGDYSDARQWRCYCTAINLIVSHKDTDPEEIVLADVARARVLFSLLSKHHFADSADWLIYCTARRSEADGYAADALKQYESIFLHDSPIRYLELLDVLSREAIP